MEQTPSHCKDSDTPQKMGCKPTDNNTGELLATSLAYEMLPPSLRAITICNSTTTMGTFRILRDSSIPSSRALLQKVMSRCGKGYVGRLLRNLAHHSQKSLHLANSSIALQHHIPTPNTPFLYHDDTNDTRYKTAMEDQTTKNNEHIYYPTAIKWQLQQDRTRTREETIHNDTIHCPIGGINTKTQEWKRERHTYP